MEILKYGVSWAIAIAFGLLSMYYFLHNKRRKQIQADVSFERLMSSVPDGLSVSYNGTTVRDPYVLSLAVSNIGKKDVSSKDFDQEEPILFETGSTIVALLGDQDSRIRIAEESASLVEIAAGKIGADSRFRIRVLTDGEPKVKLVANPMIDVDIVKGRYESSSIPPFGLMLVSLAIPGVLFAILLSGASKTGLRSALGEGLYSAIFLALFLMIVAGSWAFNQWIMRAYERRKGNRWVTSQS